MRVAERPDGVDHDLLHVGIVAVVELRRRYCMPDWNLLYECPPSISAIAGRFLDRAHLDALGGRHPRGQKEASEPRLIARGTYPARGSLQVSTCPFLRQKLCFQMLQWNPRN